MASSKQKLQGLIGAQPPIQKGEPYRVSGGARGTPTPVETTTIQRGAAFTVSTTDEAEVPLPEAVLALRVELREIARSYIGARRRSGRALLEAARWLSEARAAAAHGEWDDFLAATATTADTSERLLRIYERSMRHPAFAAAVADGRLNQSAAERLARSSTSAEVIDEVLTAEKPPTVAEVDRAIRAAKQGASVVVEGDVLDDQIPQIAGFGGGAEEMSKGREIPPIAEFGANLGKNPQNLATLQKVVSMMSDLALHPARVPVGDDTERALDMIEQAVATIRAAVDRR